METYNPSNSKARAVGVYCIAASILAFVLSVGMPGIGWMIAALALIVSGLPGLGGASRYTIAVLTLSTFHLFSLGPMSAVGQGGVSGASMPFLTIFIIVPFLAAVIPLFLALIRARRIKKHADM